MVSGGASCGMGPISLWTLGVGRAVGLDLGGQCALGVRPLPLWALGADRAALGLAAGTDRGCADLRAGVRRVHRRSGIFSGLWRWRWSCVVPAWAGRAILPLVPPQ